MINTPYPSGLERAVRNSPGLGAGVAPGEKDSHKARLSTRKLGVSDLADWFKTS
jgi:hypothetical protein